MNKLCRLGGLIRSESRFPLQRLAPFSSLSAASPRLSNFSNEEDEFEDGGSAVYRYALKNQRPTTIAWIHRLANSVSFIGYVDQHPEIYNCKGSAIGAHTYLNARNRNDSYRGLRSASTKLTFFLSCLLDSVYLSSIFVTLRSKI